MLNERTLVEVQYTKTSTGETTDRVIIPMYVPRPNHHNVKAIDVTGLSAEERAGMEELMNEYNEYIEAQRKTLFTLEQFIEHTTGRDTPELKWRTFKPEYLKEL